jgi:hypothetical protein
VCASGAWGDVVVADPQQKRCYVGLSFYASTESRGIEAPDTERFLRSRQLARESLSERALSTESDWHLRDVGKPE